MEYRELSIDEISKTLFESFIRYQEVTQCWRKIDGAWVIKDISFIEDWDESKHTVLVNCLKNTIETGGVVFGAFDGYGLKGFASVESAGFGKNHQYLDLSCIHVSQDMRGNGIGKQLFDLTKKWAKQHLAQKLYISSHSAVETQAFYKAMGCVEDEEYNQCYVDKEPCDCQLECVL